jgi:endoglucanase
MLSSYILNIAKIIISSFFLLSFPVIVNASEIEAFNVKTRTLVNMANYVIEKKVVVRTQSSGGGGGRSNNSNITPANVTNFETFKNYSPFVNLAGAEFGGLPGVMYQQYIYPTESIKKLEGSPYKGIRLPFRWERIQPELYGELNSNELAVMKAFLDEANKYGYGVVLDLHNYFERKLNNQTYKIGSVEVSNNAFSHLWQKMAIEFKDHPAVIGYGLMNEPHDTDGKWPAAAQAAVNGIRKIDTSTPILVSGDAWSGAHSWDRNNALLHTQVVDPNNNLIFEAHQYFDSNYSGTYPDNQCISAADAVSKINVFVNWLKVNNLKGFIGEYNVPDEPNCLNTLEQAVRTFESNGIPHAIWAAGPWWGSYVISVEAKDGKQAVQTEIVRKVVGN